MWNTLQKSECFLDGNAIYTYASSSTLNILYSIYYRVLHFITNHCILYKNLRWSS